LAFHLKSHIGLSLEQLLDWTNLVPSVVPVAIPHLNLIRPDNSSVDRPVKEKSAPREPHCTETSIIIPTGLVLSPHEFVRWKHQIVGGHSIHSQFARPQKTTVERWETTAIPSKEFADKNKTKPNERLTTLRAIHSEPTFIEPTIAISPDLEERRTIVIRSAGFDNQEYNPIPLTYNDLRLSSMGGSLKVQGSWPHTAPFGVKNVTKYVQDTVQSRDQLVRIETAYYGCNIPIVGKLIEIRAREFLPVKDTKDQKGIGAVILKRWFSSHIPHSEFETITAELVYGRRWPFKRVVFSWPDEVELNEPIDVIQNDPIKGLRGSDINACWLIQKCGTEPLLIEVTTTDRQDKTQSFKLPMMFIRQNIAMDKLKVRPYLELYLKEAKRRPINFAGQLLGFVAQPPERKEKRGAFPVDTLVMNVEYDDKGWCWGNHLTVRPPTAYPAKFPPDWEIAYYPSVAQFDIRLPEVQAYSIDGKDQCTVGWNPIYTNKGFTANGENVGELFLDINQLKPLGFAGDKGGGLANPSLNIQSLSRLIGVVGGGGQDKNNLLVSQESKLANGTFDPNEFFPENAKIIGGIKLRDVLKLINQVTNLSDIPQLAGENYADLQAAAEVLSDVGKLVDVLIKLGEAIAPETITRLKSTSDKLVSSLSEFIEPLRGFLDTLIDLIKKPRDEEGVLSFSGTFAILADSVLTNYSDLDLNSSLLELRSLFNIDRLASELVNAPINAIRGELSNFDLRKLILPAERLKKIIELIRNPDSLLDGSFFEEARSALAGLTLGANGLMSVVRSLISGFRDNIRQALGNSLEQITQSVELYTAQNKKDSFRHFLDTRFPESIKKETSPFAYLRLNSFEDHLQRSIIAPLQQTIEELSSNIDDHIDNNFTVTEIQPLLAAIEKAFEYLKKEVEVVLKELEKLVNKMPRTISVGYSWDTELQCGPKDFEIFVAKNSANGKRARLQINSKIEKKLGFKSEALLSKPTAQASISLTDFQIVLIPKTTFLTITFRQLLVKSDGFNKPQVSVVIEDVAFGQSLEFVQKLAELLSPGNGFQIGVTPKGIEAGYALGIPAFSIGVFNLADLSIGIGLILPFTEGALNLALNVSERHRPCLLSVGIFGGTAFFRIVVEPQGKLGGGSVKEIEAALEFGAVAAVTLGPASGRLYAFGGIYYSRTGESVTFVGYVRAGGCLDVLGLISASVEFYLALQYIPSENTARGIASVTVHVKIIFVINVRVTLTYEKRFAGSSSSQRSRANSNKLLLSTTQIAIRDSLVMKSHGIEGDESHVPLVTEEWVEYCRLFG
jgi:hypothetical protein